MWGEGKKAKGAFIGLSVGYIVLGLVLLLWPQISMNIICYVLGAAAVALGAIKLWRYFTADGLELIFMDMSTGVVALLIGLVLLIKPALLLGLIPIILGVMIAVDGTARVRTALDLRTVGYSNWVIELILAIVSVALGILLIVNPMFSLGLATAFIGAALCVDGIINLWDVFYISRQLKKLRG